MFIVLVLFMVGTFLFTLYLIYGDELFRRSEKSSNSVEAGEKGDSSDKKAKAPSAAPKKSASHVQNHKLFASKAQAIIATGNKDHPLYFNEIGGHTTSISCFAFSIKGDYVATSSSDGNIRCMLVEEIGKALQHDIHVTLSTPATSLVFTQNSKRLLVAANSILKFFKMPSSGEDRKLELVKDVQSGLQDIDAIQVLDVEKWMTVLVAGKLGGKPRVRAFNSKGDILTDLSIAEKISQRDKKHIRKSYSQRVLLVTSPDDLFVAITGVGEAEGVGFGDVGIFEVSRRKDGETAGIVLKFFLSGHESEVTAVSWSSTGKRAITLCADGSWRFWDTSIRYNEFEQPRAFSSALRLPGDAIPSAIALVKGPSGPSVVLVHNRDIIFCTTGSGEVLEKVEGALGANVTALRVSADGALLACVVAGAKRVSLWTAP